MLDRTVTGSLVLAGLAAFLVVGCASAPSPAPAAAARAPTPTPPAASAASDPSAATSAPTPPPTTAPPGAAPAQLPPTPCTGSERGQFDFWVGTWTVRNPAGDIVGRNVIERAHRGCAVMERWTSARGGTGSSQNYWVPRRKQWHQSWVDGGGGVIQLDGGLEGGAMKLEGTYAQADGTVSRLRGTWTPLKDGRVRQLFEESKDDGATWTIWFDGYYERQ